jgi:hypothetical protein
MIESENNLCRKIFDIDIIMKVQSFHSIEVIKGSDGSYDCLIDNEVFAVASTPLLSLMIGCKKYLEYIQLVTYNNELYKHKGNHTGM